MKFEYGDNVYLLLRDSRHNLLDRRALADGSETSQALGDSVRHDIDMHGFVLTSDLLGNADLDLQLAVGVQLHLNGEGQAQVEGQFNTTADELLGEGANDSLILKLYVR